MTRYDCPECGHWMVERNRKPEPLTDVQAGILSFIIEWQRRRGVSPTFRDISERYGYRSLATVAEHVRKLEDKGWIRTEYRRHQSIEVLHKPEGV